MLDRILKILWLVNGVLFLAFISFVGYRLFLEQLNSYGYDNDDTALVVGDDAAEQLIRDGELQGLVYGAIENVQGTSVHILPVSAQRFRSRSDEGNSSSSTRCLGLSAGINDITSNNINLIFLDIDYRVINTLLPERAFIHAAASPPLGTPENTLDPSIQNLIYLISFEDSNNDGLLSESDSSDLYISDVDGSNLTRITRNVFVTDYKFINNNAEVLITYQRRGDLDSEYRRTRFAKYRIAKETLVEMSDLHQELLRVEKLLQVDSIESKP